MPKIKKEETIIPQDEKSPVDEIFEESQRLSDIKEPLPQDTQQEEPKKEEPTQENEKEINIKPEEEEKKEEVEEKVEDETEEKKEEEIEKDKKTPEKKEEIVDEKEKKLLEELGLKKFKTLKDALEAYKNLEAAYTKSQAIISSYQKGVIPQEVKEGVEGAVNIISRPRVRFDLPNPSDYMSGDTFDVRAYLEDALNQYTIQLQKSLVFGELGAALYTLQKTALTDKYTSIKSQEEIDKQATEIKNELLKLYPDLETDNAKAERLSRAIAGAASLKGQPLTKEEILKIAYEEFGETGQKQKTKITEKPSVFSASSYEEPTKSRKSPIEQGVDDIFSEDLKRKQYF